MELANSTEFTNPVESVNSTLQLRAPALGASEVDASFTTAQSTTGSGSGVFNATVTATAIPATASGHSTRGTTAHSECSLPTFSHHPNDCVGASQLVDMHNDLHAAFHGHIDQCRMNGALDLSIELTNSRHFEPSLRKTQASHNNSCVEASTRLDRNFHLSILLLAG